MSVFRTSRASAHVIREGILKFYDDKKLWPRGMTSAMECIRDWALRMGDAIKSMATLRPTYAYFFVDTMVLKACLRVAKVGRTRRLMKRATSSKLKKLNHLRARINTLKIKGLETRPLKIVMYLLVLHIYRYAECSGTSYIYQTTMTQVICIHKYTLITEPI